MSVSTVQEIVEKWKWDLSWPPLPRLMENSNMFPFSLPTSRFFRIEENIRIIFFQKLLSWTKEKCFWLKCDILRFRSKGWHPHVGWLRLFLLQETFSASCIISNKKCSARILSQMDWMSTKIRAISAQSEAEAYLCLRLLPGFQENWSKSHFVRLFQACHDQNFTVMIIIMPSSSSSWCHRCLFRSDGESSSHPESSSRPETESQGFWNTD